jgi:regulator of sirC expression with transglutaminase-like and TPR domain
LREIMYCALGVAIVLGSLLASERAVAASGHENGLLIQIVDLERKHAAMCMPPGGEADLQSSLGLLTKDFAPESGLGKGGLEEVESLNHRIFAQAGIRSSVDLKDPCNLLPSRVLDRKQGYCVGIAALYLVLAEHLELPIYAVATPSHVFLRYDDGTIRINIETLHGGANVPDEQYVREQKIPEESIRRGIFMRNLSAGEFLAQMHNNLGVVYSERKNYDAAAKEYEIALDLDARLPAALYNWGNDLLRQGEYRKAIRRFSKSLRLYPTDVWTLNNRGLAYGKLGRREKARRDLEEALRIEPGFEQAQRNLGETQSPP